MESGWWGRAVGGGGGLGAMGGTREVTDTRCTLQVVVAGLTDGSGVT